VESPKKKKTPLERDNLLTKDTVPEHFTIIFNLKERSNLSTRDKAGGLKVSFIKFYSGSTAICIYMGSRIITCGCIDPMLHALQKHLVQLSGLKVISDILHAIITVS